MVKIYGEIDPIQLAWMVNQMESYGTAASSVFLSLDPPLPAAGPGTGTQYLGAVVVALHLVHGRPKVVGVRQLGRKVALSK